MTDQPICEGCQLPQGQCDCPALNLEEERARWEDQYSHSTRCCTVCQGWFPRWALTPDGKCAGCNDAPRGEVL